MQLVIKVKKKLTLRIYFGKCKRPVKGIIFPNIEIRYEFLMIKCHCFVFRVIVKSLFLGYFHAPAPKRPEAIKVIGHILSFTKEEMEEVSHIRAVLMNHPEVLLVQMPFINYVSSSVSQYTILNMYYCSPRLAIQLLLLSFTLFYSGDIPQL